MKISKSVLSFIFMGVAGLATIAATYFDIQDTLDDCREMYRDEIRDMIDEEFENRAKAS